MSATAAAADAEDDAAAADLLASIDRRLASLQEWSIVELAQCRGPLSLHAELAVQVNGHLAVVDGLVEDLALLAEQHPSPRRRLELIEQCSQRSSQLGRLRNKVRDAALASRRRIQASTVSSMRSELFSVNASAHSKASKGEMHTSKDDELMSATSNVTDGLRRTRQLMEQELERSVLSTQMLERSSQTLALTSNQYTSFSDILSASKKLITALEKADVLDRLLITAALIFFFLVCLLIVKRRIIDRGIRAASLVGKVAGGAGHVANRGARAILAHDAPAQLKDTATSLAQSVTTALASVGTAAASISTAPLLSRSIAPAKTSSTTISTPSETSSATKGELTLDVEPMWHSISNEQVQEDHAAPASSELEETETSFSLPTTSPHQELMQDEFGQGEGSTPAGAVTTDLAHSPAGTKDVVYTTKSDVVFVPGPSATIVEVVDDADSTTPVDNEPSTSAEDAPMSPELESDSLDDAPTLLGQTDVDEDTDDIEPARVAADDSKLAIVDHDEL